MGLGAFVVTSSCKDNAILAELKALGEECFLDSDCNDPLVCVFGTCHVECQTDPDCVAAAESFDVHPRCVVGDKPSNVCLNGDEVDCSVETDEGTELTSALCPGALWCGPDGECRSRCASEIDCLTDQVCVQGSCASPEELDENGLLSDPADSTQGVPCSYHSECVAPLVCRAQVCSEQCLGDVDCAEGFLCVVDDSVEILGPVRVCRKPGGGGPLIAAIKRLTRTRRTWIAAAAVRRAALGLPVRCRVTASTGRATRPAFHPRVMTAFAMASRRTRTAVAPTARHVLMAPRAPRRAIALRARPALTTSVWAPIV